MDDFFIMNEDRENKLWSDSLIVFDTNAICSLYRMTESTKNTMIEIIKFLKESIWIPAHVIYEYRKNRIEVINEIFGDFYFNPEFFKINRDYHQKLEKYLKCLESRKNYHPYFEEKSLEEFKAKSEDVQKGMKGLEDYVRKEYAKRKVEIESQKKDDPILDTIMSLSQGTPYTYAETLEIVREGEWRYKNKLPPGYKDAPNKYGTQIYGDLIIWKEILKKSKSDNKSVIVVTNDKKEDWYEKHDENCEPTCPRHELIREFQEYTGKDVWFYTLDQFISQLELRFKDKGLRFYEGLEEVRYVLEYSALEKAQEERIRKAKLIRCECDNCHHKFTVDANDFEFDWEATGGDPDRGMGPETEYECTELFECPECGQECSATFHVWEYPIGCYNYDEIESDGCSVNEDDIDLSKHISFEDREQCEQCGAYAVLDEFGMCQDCAENKRRELESDD